jgi:hypothetical protein
MLTAPVRAQDFTSQTQPIDSPPVAPFDQDGNWSNEISDQVDWTPPITYQTNWSGQLDDESQPPLAEEDPDAAPSMTEEEAWPAPIPEEGELTEFKAECDSCGQKACKCDPACCLPPWAHRTGVFGEYLYMRSRDGDVGYAVGIDGDIAQGNPQAQQVQVTPIQIVDTDYTSNYRVGFSFCLTECTSLVATYTSYAGSEDEYLNFDPATNNDDVIRALVLHPVANDANADFLAATANLGIDFDTIDLDYRSVFAASDLGALNYSFGARYANLNQDFSATFSGTGTFDQMVSDVEFEGAGLRFGLDAERHHACNGFLAYAKGMGSAVVGIAKTRYQAGNDVDPSITDTGWSAGRMITTLDLELGLGWQSPCGHFRFTGGYMASYWFNTVTQDQWIRSVQRNNFVGQHDNMSHDTLSFDGLTVRAEYRF